MMRKVFKNFISANPGTPMEALLPYLVGNVGLVFTNGDLGEVREAIECNRVPAPARVGSIAPVDVVVPKGQTEIINDVLLTKEGEQVGNSEAALLQKLDIRPFTYGMIIVVVYDNGSMFSPKVLDLSEDDLCAKFIAGVQKVAAVSLELNYPRLSWLILLLSLLLLLLLLLAMLLLLLLLLL